MTTYRHLRSTATFTGFALTPDHIDGSAPLPVGVIVHRPPSKGMTPEAYFALGPTDPPIFIVPPGGGAILIGHHSEVCQCQWTWVFAEYYAAVDLETQSHADPRQGGAET